MWNDKTQFEGIGPEYRYPVRFKEVLCSVLLKQWNFEIQKVLTDPEFLCDHYRKSLISSTHSVNFTRVKGVLQIFNFAALVQRGSRADHVTCTVGTSIQILDCGAIFVVHTNLVLILCTIFLNYIWSDFMCFNY